MTEELRKKLEQFVYELKESPFNGFMNEVDWYFENLWHDASVPHDESKLLIVKLISGQVALYRGSFNNAERDFGIYEATEHGSEPKGIIEEWCYFDDILPDNK